jgi:hypothetical protein
MSLSALASAAGTINLIRAFPIHGAERAPIVAVARPELLAPLYRGAIATLLLVLLIALVSLRRHHAWSARREFGGVGLICFTGALVASALVVFAGLPTAIRMASDALHPGFVTLLRVVAYISLAFSAGLCIVAVRKARTPECA